MYLELNSTRLAPPDVRDERQVDGPHQVGGARRDHGVLGRQETKIKRLDDAPVDA